MSINERKIMILKIAVWLLCFLIAILTLILVSCFLYFFNGSLEMFPTKEQQGKVKFVLELMILGLVILKAVIWGFIKVIRKKIKKHDAIHGC